MTKDIRENLKDQSQVETKAKKKRKRKKSDNQDQSKAEDDQSALFRNRSEHGYLFYYTLPLACIKLCSLFKFDHDQFQDLAHVHTNLPHFTLWKRIMTETQPVCLLLDVFLPFCQRQSSWIMVLGTDMSFNQHCNMQHRGCLFSLWCWVGLWQVQAERIGQFVVLGGALAGTGRAYW